MKLPIFIDVAILLLSSFLLKKKKLTIFENAYLLMILLFVVTCYCAILYLNLKLWSLSDETGLFTIFRVYEAIVAPFLWVLYFNIIFEVKNRSSKWFITIAFVGLQLGAEQWLVSWKVISYEDWHLWKSLMIQMLVLGIAYLALIWYQRILKQEGSCT